MPGTQPQSSLWLHQRMFSLSGVCPTCPSTLLPGKKLELIFFFFFFSVLYLTLLYLTGPSWRNYQRTLRVTSSVWWRLLAVLNEWSTKGTKVNRNLNLHFKTLFILYITCGHQQLNMDSSQFRRGTGLIAGFMLLTGRLISRLSWSCFHLLSRKSSPTFVPVSLCFHCLSLSCSTFRVSPWLCFWSPPQWPTWCALRWESVMWRVQCPTSQAAVRQRRSSQVCKNASAFLTSGERLCDWTVNCLCDRLPQRPAVCGRFRSEELHPMD